MSLTTVFIYPCFSGEFIISGFFIKYSLRGPFLGKALFFGFFEGDAFGFLEGEVSFPFKKKSCIKILNILQILIYTYITNYLRYRALWLMYEQNIKKKNSRTGCQNKTAKEILKNSRKLHNFSGKYMSNA